MDPKKLNEQEQKDVNGGTLGTDSTRLKVNNNANVRATNQDDEERQDVRFSDNTSADFHTED